MNLRSLTVIALATGLLAASAAYAQQPAAPPAAPPDLNAIPEKMPFNIPYGAPISADRAQSLNSGGCRRSDQARLAGGLHGR